MATPTLKAWRKVKKPARYLVWREAVVYSYECQEEECCSITLFTDSEWAGCRRTRKSTSGGVIMVGRNCIKSWSTTQGPVALSSAEAKYYSMVEETMRAKNLQSVGSEIGMKSLDSEITLATDSSAAKSFVARKGIGRMRPMDVRYLWLQTESSYVFMVCIHCMYSLYVFTICIHCMYSLYVFIVCNHCKSWDPANPRLSALNRVWTLPDYSSGPELLKSSGVIDLQNEYNMLVAKQWFLYIFYQCHIIRVWTLENIVRKMCKVILIGKVAVGNQVLMRLPIWPFQKGIRPALGESMGATNTVATLEDQ